MSVRNATALDGPALAMLGDAVVRGEDRDLITWETLPNSLAVLLSSPSVCSFVNCTGSDIDAAIIGSIAQVPWKSPHPIACVVLWWSHNPIGSLRVMSRFRKWAKASGAELLLSGARDERTGALYSRLGLRPVETNYIGAL